MSRDVAVMNSSKCDGCGVTLAPLASSTECLACQADYEQGDVRASVVRTMHAAIVGASPALAEGDVHAILSRWVRDGVPAGLGEDIWIDVPEAQGDRARTRKAAWLRAQGPRYPRTIGAED